MKIILYLILGLFWLCLKIGIAYGFSFLGMLIARVLCHDDHFAYGFQYGLFIGLLALLFHMWPDDIKTIKSRLHYKRNAGCGGDVSIEQ